MLKVTEIQAQLQEEDSEEEDGRENAMEAGYVACAIETINFLAAEGLGPDHPLMRTLHRQLQLPLRPQ